MEKENNQQLTCINAGILEGNDIGPKLTKGETYSLKQSHVCKCGQVHYDVGIVSRLSYVTCYKCREDLPQGNKIHWCNSIRFVNL